MDNILDANVFEGSNYNKKDFESYKRFHNAEQAKSYATLLADYNIPYLIEGSQTILDEAIVGSPLLPKVILKLRPEDFSRANQVIMSEMVAAEDFSVEDHYLNQLENEELLAIFEKQDEWEVEDIQVAQFILEKRGVPISSEKIQVQREQRLETIRKGKSGNRFFMLLYALSIALGIVIHPLFVIAGIGMGYYYAYGKSVDPDGNRYFTFDAPTRKYGKLVLYGGIVVLAFSVTLLIFWAG